MGYVIRSGRKGTTIRASGKDAQALFDLMTKGNEVNEQVKNAFEEAAELRASHDPDKPAKRPQGFNTMDPARVKEIAAMGGKVTQARGKAPKFTSETARIAGRKGLLARGYKV